MKSKRDRIYKYSVISMIIIFLIMYLFLSSHWMSAEILYNIMIIIILTLFLAEWIYYIFLDFNIILTILIPTIILFLIGRPLSLLIQCKEWAYYGQEATIQYLFIMFMSVLGIIMSKFIPSLINKLKEILVNRIRKRKVNLSFFYIKQVLKIGANKKFTVMLSLTFYITFLCYIITKVAELINMSGKTYLEYYLANNITLPWIITFMSSLSLYVMCFYLAYIVSKKKTFVILLVFILTTIPNLIIGQRNPFILSILFSISIIYIKNVVYWKIKINKKLFTISLLTVGILLSVSMAIISSKRNNQQENKNILELATSFVYDQGNTYETLCIGITHKEKLRTYPNNHYTFSAVIDYFKYGKIGNVFFDTNPLPGGNNETRAKFSNDLAHKLSFLALKDNYLKGAGIGTTYVLETYLDYGYIGVFLINCFYMLFSFYAMNKFGKNILFDTVVIFALMKIFFIGRDSALIPFSGLITIHYFFILSVIYIFYFCSKKSKEGKIIDE